MLLQPWAELGHKMSTFWAEVLEGPARVSNLTTHRTSRGAFFERMPPDGTFKLLA